MFSPTGSASFFASQFVIDSDERLQCWLDSRGLEPITCHTVSGFVLSVLPGEGGCTLERQEGSKAAVVKVTADGKSMLVESDDTGAEMLPVSRDCPVWCRPLLLELATTLNKIKAGTVGVVFDSPHGKGRLMREVYPGSVRRFEYRVHGKGKVKISAAVGNGKGDRTVWSLRSYHGGGDQHTTESQIENIEHAKLSFETCLRLEAAAVKFPVVAAHRECAAKHGRRQSSEQSLDRDRLILPRGEFWRVGLHG